MSKGSVMLVEDDASMQALLKVLLEIEGYQVAMAQNLDNEQLLVENIRQAKPNVLLMDVHLHQSSGIEVLKKLRADPDLTPIRIIMTSGMDVKEKCMEAGASSFLLKPYMPDELIQKIKG